MLAAFSTGARPSEPPIIQPTRFELVINRTSANALGLKVKAIVIAFVLAEALPIPKGQGQCPSGYISEARYCVPANPNTPIAVPESPGQQCPSTMIQSGGSLHR